jgi:hypothetical protein
MDTMFGERPGPFTKLCPCCEAFSKQECTATDSTVRCTKCGLSVTKRHSPRADDGVQAAAEAWNRRPSC